MRSPSRSSRLSVGDLPFGGSTGGFFLFSMGEWASWLAIVVFAFDRGGPGETPGR